VRHEVVHNKFVVDRLKTKGAIFVEEIDEVPTGKVVIFSAHGVSKAVCLLSKFNLSTSATVSISATLELWFDCPKLMKYQQAKW
jgi:4-hydroxy-3-methylbut-2-enyl diphosphate reductase